MSFKEDPKIAVVSWGCIHLQGAWLRLDFFGKTYIPFAKSAYAELESHRSRGNAPHESRFWPIDISLVQQFGTRE